MELKIKKFDAQETIQFNFDELKKEITDKAEFYKNLVYTDESIKDAKADRATLNKFIKALEDKRKEVKKQCLKPYEEFGDRVKELVAIINEPVGLIDSQVKSYEEKVKADKEASIKEIFTKEAANSAIDVKMENIWDDKWLNLNCSIKKAQEAIHESIEQINRDVETIKSLPEYSFEALEVYKTSLNLSMAISEGRRLADIQKRKEEHLAQEATKKETEAEKANVEEASKKVEKPTAAKETPSKTWFKFRAFMTNDEVERLRMYLDLDNVEWEEMQ